MVNHQEYVQGIGNLVDTSFYSSLIRHITEVPKVTYPMLQEVVSEQSLSLTQQRMHHGECSEND